MQPKQMVNQADIVNELNLLWKSCPPGETSKACLFNLIIYCDPQKTAFFKEAVKKVTEQFPCRILFIEGNPASAEDKLFIQVTEEKGGDSKGIPCDQVVIQAEGSSLSRVPFLILPLYVPDLPIYLLWGQDPTADTLILPHLQPFAKRLIFDSEITEDLQEFSQKLIKQIQSCSIDVVDMNWARIGGWREVLSETFDSSARFQQLATANTISIFYNNLRSELCLHPHTRAIYLQAWLASRLNWEFVSAKRSDGSFSISYRNAQGAHEILIIPENHEVFPSEEILGIDITGPKNYDCHLIRTDVTQVKISAHNQDQCELPFSLFMTSLKSGRNFMQEIFFQKASEQYLPMLKLISSFKWS